MKIAFKMNDFLKIITNYFLKFILLPLYIFPVKRNRIVFISYSGLQYSCNPKYISNFLLDNYPTYEQVWVFNDIDRYHLDPSIIKIKYLSIKYFYYVITSKFYISNTGFNRFFFIRSGQRFVQTWHGGGAYKKRFINQDRSLLKKILDYQHDNSITDFISSSEYFTKYFINDSLYKGNILNIGMPRNSYLINNYNNNEILERIYDRLSGALGIDDLNNKYIVLYAPTWRDDGSTYNFPRFDEILSVIESKFNKEPVLFLRSHHFQDLKDTLSCEFYDLRDYPDMQDLLLVSDMLISDYSSSIWDYSLLKKPCFLYVPDLEHYNNMRGFYTPSSSWGFDVCENSEQLIFAISNFDEKSYRDKIITMHKVFGSFENRSSNEKLLNILGIHK